MRIWCSLVPLHPLLLIHRGAINPPPELTHISTEGIQANCYSPSSRPWLSIRPARTKLCINHMYLHVFICIYMYLYIHIYIYVFIHIYKYSYVFVCIYIICLYMSLSVFKYTVFICIFMYLYVFTCIHMYLYVYVFICIYCICMHALFIQYISSHVRPHMFKNKTSLCQLIYHIIFNSFAGCIPMFLDELDYCWSINPFFYAY